MLTTKSFYLVWTMFSMFLMLLLFPDIEFDCFYLVVIGVAGVAWYSAQDRNGRTYYYEENGNESCWQLPSVSQTIQVSTEVPGRECQSVLSSVAEPKLFIFGSGSDFDHNFGSGSSSSYSHILAL